MADHVRKQLRQAIATAVTGLATTGANVFQSRAWPLERANLPAILVYPGEEALELVAFPRAYQRAMSMQIEACARAGSALDDTLDLIGKEAEVALAGGVVVGGKSVELVLSACRFEWDAQDKIYGSLVMTWEALMFSGAGAPDVPL